MVAALSSAEKALLRAGGHKVELFMSVQKPGTLLLAELNDPSIARGDRSIAYDSGTGSGYASILAGMPLWVGTASGESDKGTTRIKSITGDQTSGTIVVAENAIDWGDNDYLAVMLDFPLFPIRPRMTSDGTFYKDYDVAYSDQNEEPPPVAISGPHRVGFMSAGSCVFAFSQGGDSYAIASGATISTHSWAFTGTGTFDDASSATPTLTVTAVNPDGDWVYHTVTDSNGKTQTTRRLVFTHDTSGANAPRETFELEGALSGDWDRGGWGVRLRVYGDADAGEFPDETVIVLWHKVTYGSTEQFIGGPTGAKSILFAGYVRRDTTRKDWNTGDVTFEASTVDGLLRTRPMYSVVLETKRSPSTWWQYSTWMTVARVVHHLWKWHSTLLGIVDVFLPTSNTLYLSACDDLVQSDLHTQVEAFVHGHGIFAHACCNKQGQVYIEEDIQMLDDAARAAKITVSDITTADRRDNIILNRSPEREVPEVHLSGMSFDQEESVPIIAKAPGDIMEDTGQRPLQFERQVLSSQSQANELAGRALANANNTFKSVEIGFSGHYLGALDIVPQAWWTLTLVAGDTTRGIVWTNQKLAVKNISGEYDPETGSLVAGTSFQKEAEGPDGVTGDYPTTPPGQPPDPPPPPWPPPTAGTTGALIAFDEAEGCWYRPPKADDWVERDAGLPAGAVDNDVQGGWDPWWVTPEKQNTSDPAFAILFRLQVGHIYRSVDCGELWEEVTPTEDPPNDWNDNPAPTVADVTFVQRVDNIHVNKQHIILVEWQSGGLWRSWLLKTDDDGTTWSWISLLTNPESVSWTFDTSLEGWETHMAAPSDAVGVTLNWDGTEDATGNGGGSARLDVPTQLGNKWARYFFTPTEEYLTTSLTAMSGKHMRSGNVDNMSYWRIYFTDGTWWDVNLGVVSIYPNWETKSGNIPVGDAGKEISYIRLNYHVRSGDVWLDDFQLTGLGVPDQIRVLWADVDSEDGSVLLLTVWKKVGVAGSMTLQKRATADLSLTSAYGVGFDISAAEIAAKTFIAYPHTPLGDKGLWFVFGRLERLPDEEGTTIRHVVKTEDGGINWANVEDGWSGDHCSAFTAGTDDGAGNRVLTAVRSPDSSKPGSLYRGTNLLGLVSTLPFGNDRGVLVDALTVARRVVGMGILESIACGADAAGAVMVAFTDDPFTAWIDVTDSYPATGVVRSLAYL